MRYQRVGEMEMLEEGEDEGRRSERERERRSLLLDMGDRLSTSMPSS